MNRESEGGKERKGKKKKKGLPMHSTPLTHTADLSFQT